MYLDLKHRQFLLVHLSDLFRQPHLSQDRENQLDEFRAPFFQGHHVLGLGKVFQWLTNHV